MNAFDLMKNCPFCNSRNLNIRGEIGRWVGCEECSCEGPGHGTEEEAIEAWNRRHDETPSEFERLCGKENSHV